MESGGIANLMDCSGASSFSNPDLPRQFRREFGKSQQKFALLGHCERVYASFAPAARSALLKGPSRQATG